MFLLVVNCVRTIICLVSYFCCCFFFFFKLLLTEVKPAVYLEIRHQLRLLISFSNLFLLCFYITPEKMLQVCKCECPNLFFSF